MPQQERLTPAERELEKALGRLKPAAASIDRDRLLFQAGQRSVRRSVHLWRAVAAVLVAGIGLALAIPPQPRQVERVVYVGVGEDKRPPAEPGPAPSAFTRKATRLGLGKGSYIRLQRRVLAEGLDALPASRKSAGSKSLAPLDIDELLNTPALGT